MVLALLAGVHPVHPAPVQMGITQGGNQAVLFWPAAATNYILQSTTNLAAQNWVTVSNVVPMIINNNVTVTVTNTSLARFFRLYNTNAPAIPPGMALIPAGSFTIGDTLDGESDAIPTNVYMSAFYMDTNLVSSNQWAGVHNYATNHGYSFANAGAGKAANHPVQTVDWFDCVKWCNARSVQAGLTPVYYTDAGMTQVYTNGEVTITNVNWSANGYRLPTEAEWEKAARGGLSGQRFPWGDIISETNANYYGCSNGCGFSYDLGPNGNNAVGAIGGFPNTSPVGYFAANGYGLYDMAGNVFEWCWDWYAAPTYPPGSPYLGGTNPRGPVGPLIFRVLRGGDLNNYADDARCAYRYDSNLHNVAYNIGFRCVRGL